MGNILADLSPPIYWQDFERLTLDVCKRKWHDDYAERNGRSGQPQHGVDVYGYHYSQGERTGVQCKKRIIRHDPVQEAPANTLTAREIDSEIAAAQDFTPSLDRFIISTTGPKDVDLQEHVRECNANNPPYRISLWFWDDYVEHLNNDADLMYRYYSDVLRHRSKYSQEEHYFRMLSMTFDRPAIRTPFHLENRAVDFITALSATQNAIATGRLVDNAGNVIDEVRIPKQMTQELREIQRLLQEARQVATNAMRNGIIVQHETVIEIQDPYITEQLNSFRLEAVHILNGMLATRGLPLIDIPKY